MLNKTVFFRWKKEVGPVLYIQLKNKKYGICFCHRIKERSFKIGNFVFPICSRCTGILAGFAIGLVLLFFNLSLNPIASSIITIPLIVDGTTQLLNYRKSNNILRAITGLLFGIGFIFILGGIIYG